MAEGVIESCPHCGAMFGCRFLGVGSGLGSSEYVCKSCKQVFLSGRYEWRSMGLVRKGWYVVLSVAYSMFAGFLGGLLAQALATLVEEKVFRDTIEVGGPAYWLGFGLAATGVIVFQLVRTFWSLGRVAKDPPETIKAWFWSIHTNLLSIGMLLFMGSLFLCFLVGKLLNSM